MTGKRKPKPLVFTREERVIGAALAQTVDQSFDRLWVWNMAAKDFVEALRKYNEEIRK